ncbi:unnamed protein product, partial [Heterosigma akashiwo]
MKAFSSTNVLAFMALLVYTFSAAARGMELASSVERVEMKMADSPTLRRRSSSSAAVLLTKSSFENILETRGGVKKESGKVSVE